MENGEAMQNLLSLITTKSATMNTCTSWYGHDYESWRPGTMVRCYRCKDTRDLVDLPRVKFKDQSCTSWDGHLIRVSHNETHVFAYCPTCLANVVLDLSNIMVPTASKDD